MNTDADKLTPTAAAALLSLSTTDEEEIMKLAAVGFMPTEIAVAMEWNREKRAVFVALASVPGSDVANMIAAGRATGKAKPQIKLQEAASAGNVEAIKELQKLQARNTFMERMTYIDDDEFTP